MSEERLIHGSGTPLAAWNAWPGLAALPSWTAQDFVPPGQRAVIVAPHPDDEVLGCGGLMSLLEAAGREVLLVAVTDGEASHPGSDHWSPARLAQVRPMETRNALAALHVANAHIVRAGLPDGQIEATAGALYKVMSQHLRPTDVVFCTWRRDGHPDHEAVGYVCARASAVAGAALIEVPIWCWHWASPGDPRVPWRRARQLPLDATTLARKHRAVRLFRSQTQADHQTSQPPVLAESTLARLLRPSEVFFV